MKPDAIITISMASVLGGWGIWISTTVSRTNAKYFQLGILNRLLVIYWVFRIEYLLVTTREPDHAHCYSIHPLKGDTMTMDCILARTMIKINKQFQLGKISLNGGFEIPSWEHFIKFSSVMIYPLYRGNYVYMHIFLLIMTLSQYVSVDWTQAKYWVWL